MSDHRPRRIDRDTAERLLDGIPAAFDVAGPLAAPLAAATAPAHPDELAGERAALVAFRAAQLDPVPRPRRLSMLKITLAKLLTVKAAAVMAAAGLGGIALAAGTGVLPVQLTETPATPPAVSDAPAKPTDLPSRPSDAGDPADTPSPSMVGLCQAYAAQVGTNPGKALESPAFSALITAAGSAEQVDGYCETVAAGAQGSGARPTDVPAPPAAGDIPGNPASRAQTPTSRPGAPAGPPTAVPTGGLTPPTPGR
jgi:hypothetical protein